MKKIQIIPIKQSKKDRQKIQEAYFKKIEEYNKLSLDELKIIYNDKTKKIGGIYKKALLTIVNNKLYEESKKNNEKTKEENIVDILDNIKIDNKEDDKKI